ncbi:hypothetical protein [Lewinella cohaerens]|uniref:hypothetical protein n=1 Tax=Lewinella cohaerens TaxID=70995 RepID=UPI000361F18A|nr:hypothetical protein [Lewinella cohaerens]
MRTLIQIGSLAVILFILSLVILRHYDRNRLSGQVNSTTIQLNIGEKYCDLELWHNLTLVDTKPFEVESTYDEGLCLEEQKFEPCQSYLVFQPEGNEQSKGLFYEFFTDSTVFCLVMNMKDGKLLVGMDNSYDRNLEMIENIYLEKIMSNFTITLVADHGSKLIFEKSEDHHINYSVNWNYVTKEEFLAIQEEDFL